MFVDKQYKQLEEAKLKFKWSGGIGFIDIGESQRIKFDKKYYHHQEQLVHSELYRDIVRFRLDLVLRATSYRKQTTYLLDIGCGNGFFLKETKRLSNIIPAGIDINEDSIMMLHQNKFLVDRANYTVLTFWDSFCCILNHKDVIEQYHPKFIGLSLPIFEHKQDVFAGGIYFRPEEDYWYFSRNGLFKYMQEIGYSLLMERNEEEIKYHQPKMRTYIFTRLSIV